MIETIKIDDMNGVKDLVFDQGYDESIGKFRAAYYYRGLPNTDYQLCTSLARNCKDKLLLEKPLLDNFAKYISIEDPSINESIWKAMIVGQHHGLPTRLMDWTHSSLVALNFANTVDCLEDLDKHDCAIWRIDAQELEENLPEEYKGVLKKNKTHMFSLKTFSEVAHSLEDFDNAMGDKGIVMIEPPSIDERIVNQYSFFSIIPSGITDIEGYLKDNTKNTKKFVIDKSLRWEIRDILDQLNMSERIVYPGIDGICKWLARHYYVRTEQAKKE